MILGSRVRVVYLETAPPCEESVGEAMAQFSPVTLGRPLRSLDAGGFVLTEAVNMPLATLAPHAHELACITFVLRGSCVETIGTCPYECSPFSMIIKPAGEVHANKYGSAGARCLIIEVKTERFVTVRSFSQTLDHPAHLQGAMLTAFAARLYKEFQVADAASVLSVEGLVLEVLGETTRRSMKPAPFAPPRWLLKAQELCHEEFTRPLSLSRVAESVRVHPAHLARTFRSHFKCTIGEYVRRLRLDYAAQELTRSGKPLVEIATEAGFYDQSHFTHAFKLHTGMTPTAYRSATKICNAHTSEAISSKI